MLAITSFIVNRLNNKELKDRFSLFFVPWANFYSGLNNKELKVVVALLLNAIVSLNNKELKVSCIYICVEIRRS